MKTIPRLNTVISQGIGFLEDPNNWILITLLILVSLLSPFKKRTNHFWRIRSARKYLKTLKSIDEPSKQFSYLRKVDPFVFEEMILTALKDLGYSVKRNKRYVADGGIDGRVVINGQKILIQAKRYSQHIAASHVSSFCDICRKSGKKGLFIHTGKTGKQARIKGMSEHIEIVSGSRMLDLLTGKKFTSSWK